MISKVILKELVPTVPNDQLLIFERKFKKMRDRAYSFLRVVHNELKRRERMKVSELIEELKRFPPEMEVRYWNNDMEDYDDIESVEIKVWESWDMESRKNFKNYIVGLRD